MAWPKSKSLRNILSKGRPDQPNIRLTVLKRYELVKGSGLIWEDKSGVQWTIPTLMVTVSMHAVPWIDFWESGRSTCGLFRWSWCHLDVKLTAHITGCYGRARLVGWWRGVKQGIARWGWQHTSLDITAVPDWQDDDEELSKVLPGEADSTHHWILRPCQTGKKDYTDSTHQWMLRPCQTGRMMMTRS